LVFEAVFDIRYNSSTYCICGIMVGSGFYLSYKPKKK